MKFSSKKELNPACAICREYCGNTKSFSMTDQACEVSNCSSCLDKDRAMIIQNDKIIKLLGSLGDYLIRKDKESLQ